MPRLANKSEADVAAEILGRAFVRDPVVTAFFGKETVRTSRLAQYFALECSLAFAGYGEVWLDDDGLGAALWRRPGGYPEPLSAALRLLPRALRFFPQPFLRASRGMTRVARVHPREPHWYLFAVGVVPEATGQGRGTALLAPVLDRCDAKQLPAYLEASSEDNARLYERLGFDRQGEVEALDGIWLRPMLRPPRQSC